jgi:soluble lytic murein transglycosylase
VARVWRGTQPPKKRRWTKRTRGVYKHRATIGPALGELLDKAGIFFYGRRFKPPHPDPAKHHHPRAYMVQVTRVAQQFKLDPNLLWAVMKTESAFRTDALSPAGAIGLMQIMPVTGRRLAKEMQQETSFYVHRLFEPEVNLTMAAWYLRAVSNKFRGQLMLIAAAYNGGPHNVARWLDQRGKVTDQDEFIEEIPYAQSRRYAKKILRLVALYERVYCNKDDRATTNALDVRYSEHPNY